MSCANISVTGTGLGSIQSLLYSLFVLCLLSVTTKWPRLTYIEAQ